MSIMLATGDERFDNLLIPYLQPEWPIESQKVDLRRYLLSLVLEVKPTILIVKDTLHSDIDKSSPKERDDEFIEIIEAIRLQAPNTRIVFLALRKVTDPFLLRLINLGVYDLFVGGNLDPVLLIRQLKEPPSLKNVIHIKKKQQPETYLHEEDPLDEEVPASNENHPTRVDEDDHWVDDDDDDSVYQVGQPKQQKRRISLSMPEIKVQIPTIKFGRTEPEIRTKFRAFAAKVLVIGAVKGGVGKTDVAINLAMAIKENTDTKVAILDFDFPYGGVAQALKMKRERHLGDWITKHGPVFTEIGIKERTIQKNGVDIVPMAISLDDSFQFQEDQAVVILESLKKVYDIVIVDTSNLTPVAIVAMERATEIILVTTHDVVSINNTLSYKRDLNNRYGISTAKMSVFINKVPDIEDISKEQIAEAFGVGEEGGLPIIGYAPFDDSVRQIRNKGEIVYERDPNHPFSSGIEMSLDSLGIVPMEALKKKQTGSRRSWLFKR